MMNFRGNPKKKPRLDDDFNDWDDDAMSNDDLWGQGELTAEEFDLLEVQATQKVQQHATNDASTSFLSNVQDAQHEDLRKQQYALEGQIKILSESLDKTIRELNTERLNRDQLIAQKTIEFSERENQLKREIEKMQTAFQFKEQEMKSTQNKLHSLEQKVKEQSNEASVKQSRCTQSDKSPTSFLNRFQFNGPSNSRKDSFVQTVNTDGSNQHKLLLRWPQGEPITSDLVSSFLMNGMEKKTTSPPLDAFHCRTTSIQQLSCVAYSHLNSSKVTTELWQYFGDMLKEHAAFLKKISSPPYKKIASMRKTVTMMKGNPSLSRTSQHAALLEEIEMHHTAVVACLKDLQLLSQMKKDMPSVAPLAHNTQLMRLLFDEVESYSCPLFPEDEKLDGTAAQLPFILPLIVLTKPGVFPDYYSYKNDELEHILLVLLHWSAQKHISLDPIAYVMPIQSLASGSHGLKCASLTLRLLLELVTSKHFEMIIRHNANCLYASIADLCQSISNTQRSEYVEVVSAIQAFLGESFAGLGTDFVNVESCPCSSKLAQGYIVMLWRYHDMCSKSDYDSPLEIEILRQSVLVLHQLYLKMKNFVAKKLPVVDQYVILICGLSDLCKENVLFKNLHDIVSDLWHFEQDITPDDSDPDDNLND